MGIDWRMGAEWFETCLLDYDPCSNYGNWTYGAGKAFFSVNIYVIHPHMAMLTPYNILGASVF